MRINWAGKVLFIGVACLMIVALSPLGNLTIPQLIKEVAQWL